MAIHVARTGIVTVNAAGTVKPKTQMTIGEVGTSSSEFRVLVDTSIANTAGYPTVGDYLVAEAAAGYNLIHLDQTYVITSNAEISVDMAGADVSAIVDAIEAGPVAVEAPPVAASVVVAAGPTATVLAANGTFVSSCVVVAKSGNLSNILLGTAASQIVPIPPGATMNIVCGTGRKTDLNDYKIYGTAAEGVNILYTTVA